MAFLNEVRVLPVPVWVLVSVTSHTPESRILPRIDDSKLAIVLTIICCLPLCVNPVIDWQFTLLFAQSQYIYNCD